MKTKRRLLLQNFTYLGVTVGLLVSCAIGYDSPDGFDPGVRNTQMITPDSVSFVVNSAVTEATISWPLVLGASGYEVTFMNVDDPESPIVVDNYDKTFVDGSHFTVSVAEDSKYKLRIRTLGNDEFGNTDDPDGKEFELSTLVPSIATIPNGSDIYQYMLDHPIENVSSNEVAIDLEANGHYTMSGLVNFGGQQLTLRGDKLKRATVEMTEKGALATYSGLKVKYLNFDFSNSSTNSFIFMSPNNQPPANDTLPANILSENLGYMRGSSIIKGIYIVLNPIYVAHCWFKDLPGAFLHDNNVTCAFWNFTLSDCIVQMKNTGSEGFICLQKKGRLVKNILLENSTIYNTVDNSKAYFIRYSNSSNSNPEKTFGSAVEMKQQNITFTHTTFSKTFTGQKFCNNMSAQGTTTTSIDHCIFNDCYQVARRISLGIKSFEFNFSYGADASSDATRKDNSNRPFASVYDPQFGTNVSKSLDLTQPNGGVDFTPGDYNIVSNNGGDPRWLSTK